MQNNMKKTPNVAGMFYPDNANEISNLIKLFATGKTPKYRSKAIIVPHAGYQFSGHAMNIGYEHFAFEENVFIIAPSHHYDFQGIAFPQYEKFETPYGVLEVNHTIIQEIQDNFGCYINNTPFDEEIVIEEVKEDIYAKKDIQSLLAQIADKDNQEQDTSNLLD